MEGLVDPWANGGAGSIEEKSLRCCQLLDGWRETTWWLCRPVLEVFNTTSFGVLPLDAIDGNVACLTHHVGLFRVVSQLLE